MSQSLSGATRAVRRRSGGGRPTRKGANQLDLASFNEAAIIETIRQAGAISRTEIAQRTGLTQQSVSRILKSLLDIGLVVEGEQVREDRVGKPRTPVRLRPDAAFAVGVLVDPEGLTGVITDLDAVVRSRVHTVTSPGGSPTTLIDAIAQVVDELISRAGVDRGLVLGIGVATPGPITPDGDLLELPLSPSWRNVPLRRLLGERLDMNVRVQKDGEAAALGERWVGRDSRGGDFAYLYFGTGVGSGLVLGGDIFHGVTRNAGEFGQLCAVQIGAVDRLGRPELVRECNPTVALGQIARELGYEGEDLGFAQMCARLGDQDAYAMAAARQVADVIGRGASALIDLLDLDLMVVGGPAFVPELHEIVLDAVGSAVNSLPAARSARRVRVEASVVPTEAGAIGAASSIFHNHFAAARSLHRPR